MKIVIVGAGVIGLACAYELLHDGHEVIVLDSGSAGQAASHGNAAKVAICETGPVPAPGMVIQGLKWMLRPDSPLYVKPSPAPSFVKFMLQLARNCTEEKFRAGLDLNLRLAIQADQLFDEWQAAGVGFELYQRGCLLAYENPASATIRLRYQDTLDAHGVSVEDLDEAAVHAKEPALSNRIRRGLYYREDRQIEPDSLTSSLVDHIGERGGAVWDNDAVTGFEHGQTGITAVLTAAGHRHPADGVVLAAGVWSAALARKIGVRIPLQPGKGYSIDYTPAPVPLRTPVTFDEPHIVVTPLDGMIRVAGTMEFSGFGDGLNPTRIAAIKRAAALGLRDWDPDAPQREAWAGHRPVTPDGLPIIGPLFKDSNVWVATGHAMLGLTQAPATAREIQALVRGAKQPNPALSLRRFG